LIGFTKRSTRKDDVKKRSMLVLVAVSAVLLGAAVWAGAGGFGSDGEATATEGALDVPLAYLDGTEGNLSDFRGTPVVLNFWSSWCPACVAELPDFQQVSETLAGEVVFIGMNMQEVDRVAAAELIAGAGVTYRLADDPDGEVFRSFAGIGMPTTVFIDADGRPASVHAGALFADDLEAIIRQELLG
jgi:thiol-disulfide isomerase/thioredoxin